MARGREIFVYQEQKTLVAFFMFIDTFVCNKARVKNAITVYAYAANKSILAFQNGFTVSPRRHLTPSSVK